MVEYDNHHFDFLDLLQNIPTDTVTKYPNWYYNIYFDNFISIIF